MKSLIAIIALAFTIPAFAKLPGAITCTSNAQMPELKTFHLTGINSSYPSMNMYDVPFNENYSDKKNFSLYFSNECENSYVLTIPMKQMEKLANGEIWSVTGELEYSQYVGSEEVESYEETVKITCTKG